MNIKIPSRKHIINTLTDKTETPIVNETIALWCALLNHGYSSKELACPDDKDHMTDRKMFMLFKDIATATEYAHTPAVVNSPIWQRIKNRIKERHVNNIIKMYASGKRKSNAPLTADHYSK